MAYIQHGVGNRGFVLVNEGFRYHRRKTQSSSITWRCWRREVCGAHVKTNFFDVTAVSPRIRVSVVCMFNSSYFLCDCCKQ